VSLSKVRVIGALTNNISRAAKGHNIILFANGPGSDASLSDADTDYDWQIQEISSELVPDLRSSWLKGEPLTSDLVDTLLLKISSYGHRLLSQKVEKEFLLKLLHEGVRLNSRLSKSFLHPLYEFLQIPADQEFQKLILQCVAEAIVEGAFFLRRAMKSLDPILLDASITEFQKNGGYNRFYGGWNQEAILILKESAIDQKDVYSYKCTSLNVRGDTLLHIICSSSAPADLSNWIRHMDFEDINNTNEKGETALYRACMAGVASHVLTLLAHGANPSLNPREEGPSCLHWLFHFRTHHVRTVARALVEHGADTNASTNHNVPMFHYPFTLPLGTALHWAVAMSAIEAVHTLIDLGADPMLRNGCDPYLFDETVRKLNSQLPPDWIKCSFADHSTLGVSAIDLAVKNRDHQILKMLMSDKSRIRPDDTDEEGFTAVHRLDSGEWLYTVAGSAIWRPLFQGNSISQFHSLQNTVAILHQNGFDLDKLNKLTESSGNGMGIFEQTALMIAVWKGQSTTVKVLLDAGADVNVANSAGYTAIMSFSDHYSDDETLQAELLSLLLAANANINACAKTNVCYLTPLLHACRCRHQKVVEVLISLGANLEDRYEGWHSTSNGLTALALMADLTWAEQTSTTITKTDRWFQNILERYVMPLLSRNADEDLRQKLLETADYQGGGLLHYAAGAGLIQTCTVLLKVKVAVNGLRRIEKAVTKLETRGKEISYKTPLDEVMEAKELSYRYKVEYVPEEGMALYLIESDLSRKVFQTHMR
jgi:ankyrin repeat protein